MASHKLMVHSKTLQNVKPTCFISKNMDTKEKPISDKDQHRARSLSLFFITQLLLKTEQEHKMRATSSLVTFHQKIMRPCKNLLIKITGRRPRRHNKHLKLKKASYPSSPSSRKPVSKMVTSFFFSFQKKKQKKEKMKRLNELRSFSDAVSEKKESNKKAFPSSLTLSWLGQGKVHTQEVSQDLDAHRDSTSAFLPRI